MENKVDNIVTISIPKTDKKSALFLTSCCSNCEAMKCENRPSNLQRENVIKTDEKSDSKVIRRLEYFTISE